MSDFISHQLGVVVVDDELAERLRQETVKHWKLLLTIGIVTYQDNEELKVGDTDVLSLIHNREVEHYFSVP